MGPQDLYSVPYGGDESSGQWFYSLPAVGTELGSVFAGPRLFNWASKQYMTRQRNILRSRYSPFTDVSVGLKRNIQARQRWKLGASAAKKTSRSIAGYGKLLKRTGIGLGIYGMVQLGFDIMDMLTMPGISKSSKSQGDLSRDEVILDTRSAYTQRQRALMAIHDSQLSVSRAVIGREAEFLHK